MTGVLPSGLPTVTTALTDLDRASDLFLAFDTSANQLKSFNCGDILDYFASNTVQVNSVSDLPAASAGVRTLAASTRYVINASIDIGSDKLVMQNGTAIEGWAAQRSQIISSGTITIDTTAGGFNTCIIKGPLRIKNTNGSGGIGVNVSSGVFLISEGVLYEGVSSTSSKGIYVTSSGAAALFVTRFTGISTDTGIQVDGALSFGATVSDFNSTSLPGKGIDFNGTAGVTNFSSININGAIVSSVGNALRVVGAPTSINISNSYLNSTTNSGVVIESTSGGRIGSLNIANSSCLAGSSGTSKHGLDISSGYFTSMTVLGGQLTSTATGTSYGVKGIVPGSTPFSTSATFSGTTISGTTSPIGVMSKSDSKVTVKSCPGVADSVITGTVYITAASTFAVPLTTPSEVASSSINTNDASGSLEKSSTNISNTTFRIKALNTYPNTGTLHSTVTFSQSDATSRTYTVQLHSSVSGLVPGSETKATLKTASEPATLSVSVPVSYVENEEFFLKMASTNAHTVTFSTLTLSLGN